MPGDTQQSALPDFTGDLADGDMFIVRRPSDTTMSPTTGSQVEVSAATLRTQVMYQGGSAPSGGQKLHYDTDEATPTGVLKVYNTTTGRWEIPDVPGTAVSALPTKNALNSSDTILVVDGPTGLAAQTTQAALRRAISELVLVIPVGDETTTITTGTSKVTFRMPYAVILTAVRASLTTASSSGIPTFDINVSGTTILSTKLTVDANERTSTTAATAPVISSSTITEDAEITIDVDVAGTGAAGAKITFIGARI